EEEGQAEDEGLVERDRAKSSSHTAGTRVLRGGGPSGGGGHDDADTSTINNDFIPSNPSSLSVLSRPRARSVGGSRRGGARRVRGSSGWTGADDNSNELLPPPPPPPSTRLGRIFRLLRSLRRVAVRRGLLDWRQLGLGVGGFAAGLTCFAVQGTSATAG
ncbi:unnamed protein product, partial [Ectocarpus sp. 4 AP-2014]